MDHHSNTSPHEISNNPSFESSASDRSSNQRTFPSNDAVLHQQAPPNTYNDGAPQIGRNFYINRDQIHNHKWSTTNDNINVNHADDGHDSASFSSLSAGGATVISKVVGIHCGGVSPQDVENAGGDAHFDDNTTICPEKDEFDYAYAYTTNNQVSASHPHLMSSDHQLTTSDEEQRSTSNQSTDHSSLSSLTTDFAVGRSLKKQLVPKFDEKGRFATFGRKGQRRRNSISKSSQMELNGSPSFDKDFAINVKSKKTPSPSSKGTKSVTPSTASPWYTSTPTKKSHHAMNQDSPARSHTATHSNSDPSISTPPSPLRVNRLGEDFITSQEHIDSLVRFPSNMEPPCASKNNKPMVSVGDMDSHLNTNDTSNRSMGFGTYVASKFNDTSRRKKILALLALILFLVCIAAIMVAAFGNVGGSKDPNKESNLLNARQEDEESGMFIGKTDLSIREGIDTVSSSGDEGDGSGIEDGGVLNLQDAFGEVGTSADDAENRDNVDDQAIKPIWTGSMVNAEENEVLTPAPSPIDDYEYSTSSLGNPVKEPEDDTMSLHEKDSDEEVEATTKIQSVTTSSPPTPSPVATSPSSPFDFIDLSTWAGLAPPPTERPTRLSSRPPTPQPFDVSTFYGLAPLPTEDPTPPPSSKPTRLPTSWSIITNPNDAVYFTPIEDTSTFRNRPTRSYNTNAYLTVKGTDRGSSYLRFDISSIFVPSSKERPRIKKAALRLYSVNGDGGGLRSITVDVLPFAGQWFGEDVTWNDPVQSINAIEVGSIAPTSYESELAVDGTPILHEIDVTRAFRTPPVSSSFEGLKLISFQVYSTSDTAGGRVDFASSEYSSGDLSPELILVLAEEGEQLTPYPSKAPTKRPTNQPVVAPSYSPTTYEPTDEPTRRRPTRRPSRKPTKRPKTKNPTSPPSSIPTTSSPTAKTTTSTPSRAPIPKPVTDAPVTSAPSTKPTHSPTTSAPTPRTTTFFDYCPSEYVSSTAPYIYSHGSYVSIPGKISGSSQSKTVYQCTSARCDVHNPIYAPGNAYSSLGGWTVVGRCVEIVTETTPAPTSRPTTTSPSAKPTIQPSTSSPVKSPTSKPSTAMPSHGPSVKPTRLPTRLPTVNPTPLATPLPTEPPTPEPSPGPTSPPTPQPSNLPTIPPTPQPSIPPTHPPPTHLPTNVPTPEPSPAPLPNPTPEPSPEPTPKPTDASSPGESV